MNFTMMGKILMNLSTMWNGLDKVERDGEGLNEVGNNGERS